ncbi:MAG: UDP-N-acetylmuramate dehydrogenase [Chloroflexi bacterium]|nr:UDP-N-acetylmuramate dehydrogenase [Chloroflexota bacterium]
MGRIDTISSVLDTLAAALGPNVRRDEPLAHHTAMRVGGPVDLLIVCDNVDEVVRVVKLARSSGVIWRMLGGGCNVLVADSGLGGLMIVNRAARIEFGFAKKENVKAARVEAGAQLSVLARETVGRGLTGLEWAAGLPGTVGGAVVGNAGAFDGDIASVLHSATVLGLDGEVVERPADWFEFEYRLSRIKRETRGEVVLATTFELQKGDPGALSARADEILEWRKTRHPSGATMGSTFKNPPDSHAGYLIEQAGLRGYRVSGAQISEQHGNFFMNTGGATAADVMGLIEHARAEVRRQFGIDLELEIELVGWQ